MIYKDYIQSNQKQIQSIYNSMIYTINKYYNDEHITDKLKDLEIILLYNEITNKQHNNN
jgi:hypothetical protein